jgi:hypothetical protein
MSSLDVTKTKVLSSIIRDIGSFFGQREMTEFALRALGWVVARDACCEIVRSLAHRTPRIPLAVMRVLAKGWQTLDAAAAKTSRPHWTRTGSVSSLRPMSAETCAAVADYLTLLCTSFPELYSLPVLRERCRRAGAQALAGLGGAIMFDALAGPDSPLLADIAVVLFTMGAWGLIAFVQLRCVQQLVSQFVCRNHRQEVLGLRK